MADLLKTEQQFKNVMSECRTLFEKKLHDYGASWRILRPSSLTDQLYIKAKRIRSLEIKKESLVGEGIRPEFIALINYGITFNAVFTLLVAGRWWVLINCCLNGEDTKCSRTIAHKRIVQSCHILLSFIIQTFIALFTQRKLRNKKRDRQMFSSFLIIIIF